MNQAISTELKDSIANGNVEKTKELLPSLSLSSYCRDSIVYKLLVVAVGCPSSTTIVKLLLDKFHGQVDLKKHYFPCLLNKAINNNGNLETVQLLLERGMSPNTFNSLHLAIKLKNPDVLQLLLKHGADVNQLDDSKDKTPLMAALALDEDSTKFVKILLQKGAKINGKNGNGETAVMVAVKESKWENDESTVDMLNRLMKLGANVKTRDKEGKTPLDVAEDKGYSRDSKIVKCLRQCVRSSSKSK